MKQTKFLSGRLLCGFLFLTMICALPVYAAAPTVTITSYTDTIQINYVGVLQWSASGPDYMSSPKETGVIVAYKTDKSDAKKVVAPIRSDGKYAAIIAPKYGSCQVYVRTYATGINGITTNTDWKTMYTAAYCSAATSGMMTTSSDMMVLASSSSCSASVLGFEIKDVDLFGLGWEGIKLFTIGSCLDDGWFTFGCAFDAGTTAVIIFPSGAGEVAGTAAKLTKLSEGAKLLKEIKTAAKLSKLVRKIDIFIDGVKYSWTGLKLTRAAELSIVKIDFVKGEISTSYKELTKWFFKNGETGIVQLQKAGVTNDALETIATKGGNIEKTLKVGSSSKGVTWLEEGTSSAGWKHIVDKHVTPGQFRDIGVADNQVQNKIFETVKNPTSGILPSKNTKDSWCFFSKIITSAGKIKYVNVVRGSNGYIVTSFPTDSLICD